MQDVADQSAAPTTIGTDLCATNPPLLSGRNMARMTFKLRGLFRYPRSEPDCMTRPVSEHDQPHIQLPLETAVPTSRLRRAGAQGGKPFYQSASPALVTIGSSPPAPPNRSGPGGF